MALSGGLSTGKQMKRWALPRLAARELCLSSSLYSGGYQEDEEEILQLGRMHGSKGSQIITEAKPPMHRQAQGSYKGE